MYVKMYEVVHSLYIVIIYRSMCQFFTGDTIHICYKYMIFYGKRKDFWQEYCNFSTKFLNLIDKPKTIILCRHRNWQLLLNSTHTQRLSWRRVSLQALVSTQRLEMSICQQPMQLLYLHNCSYLTMMQSRQRPYCDCIHSPSYLFQISHDASA